MKRAMLFQKNADGTVTCQACRWYCQIKPDQTGICGVRINRGGNLYLSVWGKPVSVNIDPIEKKPLFHFYPGSQIFSLGTWGCNFACQFCQNYEISQMTKKPSFKNSANLLEELTKTLTDWPPERIIKQCREHHIPSIAYTYNEPTIFVEYAYDTARLAKKAGILNVFVSNGFESPESWQLISPYLDAINVDLKSMEPDFYHRICRAKIEPVLENIHFLAKSKIWLELTTLIIPGLNDSESQLRAIAEFILKINPEIPWHLSAFFPTYQLTNRPPTTTKSLIYAREIGLQTGLHYVYIGNVQTDYKNTFCPNCATLIIERNFFQIRVLLDKQGRCPKCQTLIPGKGLHKEIKNRKQEK